MPMNDPAPWLLAYDIAEPARLRRVHRHVRGEGVPLQYSVFLLEKTPRQVLRLRDELAELIDPVRDDVRIYRLPSRPDMETLGRSNLPEGVDLVGAAIACWLKDCAG